MINKFLSRKFLTFVATGILNIGIMTGVIPAEGKEVFLTLVDGLAGIYILAEALVDICRKQVAK